MIRQLLAAAAAGAALGVTGGLIGVGHPTASAAPKPPSFCAKHQEYLDAPRGILVGTMYVPACAIGPGNGGPDEPAAAGPPVPDPGDGGTDPGTGGTVTAP